MSFLTTMFSQGAVPVLEKVIQFSEARHRAILENVANADTPGYRRKDLSADAFNAELKRAIGRQSESRFVFDDARGVIEDRPSLLRPLSKWSDYGRHVAEGVLRHDGNNVDIEHEMALLVRNASRGSQAASLLRKLYGQVRAVVSERP